jgi:EAL domain-containing protein (putative c-di-GMP-specific phosphodiesterase class I)
VPPLLSDGDELFITPSVGVAVAPADGADPETLLKHADIAMYRAKDGGGDRFEFFTPAMTERARERLELETALRRALAGEQFRVYYQPVWDVAAGRVSAVEALVRWMHPQRGDDAAGRFPGGGRGHRADRRHRRLGAAIRLPRAARVARRGVSGTWRCSSTCPRASSAGPELLGEVRAALAESGVPAHSLELEITEGVAMRDAAATEAVLRDLKALGVRISIDDFGTGYSSLGYLRRFPLDTLKVDRTFVSDADTDRGNATIASAIIAMAHQLGLRAIAEGVERPGQMDFSPSSAATRCRASSSRRPCPPRKWRRCAADVVFARRGAGDLKQRPHAEARRELQQIRLTQRHRETRVLLWCIFMRVVRASGSLFVGGLARVGHAHPVQIGHDVLEGDPREELVSLGGIVALPRADLLEVSNHAYQSQFALECIELGFADDVIGWGFRNVHLRFSSCIQVAGFATRTYIEDFKRRDRLTISSSVVTSTSAAAASAHAICSASSSLNPSASNSTPRRMCFPSTRTWIVPARAILCTRVRRV